ncbi:MAG: hypothetical protein M3Y87_04435 [Myxococcota bacterium]|nr:hypothetical protein [Myxococcota bacterium]
MTTEIDLSFPHRFACEALSELPGGGNSRRLFFPPGQAGGRDGVTLRVQPEAGAPWIGTFASAASNEHGITRVVSLPDPDTLCVVSRGAGYIVSASTPDVWGPVLATPIVDVRAVVSAGIVVAATQTDILAIGDCGVKWRTKRLAWDGLRIVSIGDQTLRGEYQDLEDVVRTFEVDLMTGAAREHVTPPG